MSPNCNKAREQVYTYLDAELTWYRRMRIAWHLRRCPPCADGFSFERRLKQRIREDCVDDVPPELYDRLRAFLRDHKDDGPL